MKRCKKLKCELPAMKRCSKLESELPDCILSYIFSKLALKDLVKTRALSKRWIHEWGLRTDLNFDLHTMFDYNTIQDLPNTLPLFQRFHFQSQFATRLDQFMLHYNGALISSIRVKFPLGNEHRDAIDRLISKGIAKGVKHIELLLSSVTNDTTDSISPYKFPLTLLSDNDSLTYMHLQNCLLVEPLDFSGFRNLRTLVLHLVHVKQKLLQSLCSNCSHLVDFTLDDCQFTSSVIINSPTLLRLNIVNCGVNSRFYIANITIIASNLSSFEYSLHEHFPVYPMNIQAHVLSKFSFRGNEFSKHVGFSGLKNVTKILLDGLLFENLSAHILPRLFSECLQLEDVTFKACALISSITITSTKLRHLNIIDCGWLNDSPSELAIDALNLSSFEYSGHATRIISITAPRLLKVFWDAAQGRKTPHLFDPIARLPHIENLAMNLLTSQINELTKVLVRFQNLRQLELLIEGAYDPSKDYFWILDIAMASQHLQKLSLTIRNLHPEHSHIVGFKREKREYTSFSHNDLKYVDFRGCIGSINVIELASHLLRRINSLRRMTFSSRDKAYIGAGRWTRDTNDRDKYYIGARRWTNFCGGGCWFGENVIHQMLKDEVNEQCQLIIL